MAGRFWAQRRRAKTPTVLQMEAAECGAASLGMILGYHGLWVPLQELRAACDVTRDGSNARSLLAAARSFGMDARGFRRSAENVFTSRFPLIAFWRNDHFLVVEGVRGNKVYINDPAVGRRRVTREEFGASFSGIVLELHPDAGFRPGGQPQRLLPPVLAALRGAGSATVVVFITSALLGLLSLVAPAFTTIFIDNVLVRGITAWTRPLLMLMAATLLVQALLVSLQQKLLARVQNWIAVTQASRFLWHLLTLPVSYFVRRQTGDIAQRLQANERLAALIGEEAGTALMQGTIVAYTGAAMLVFQPLMAVGSLAASLASALCIAYASEIKANAVERLQAAEATFLGQTIATVQNIEYVKSIAAEHESFIRWASHQANLLNAEQRLAVIEAAISTAPKVLFGIASVLVTGLGAWFVIDGKLSLGGFAAFQMLMVSSSAAMQSLVDTIARLQGARGDIVRLEDTYQNPQDWRFDPPSGPLQTGPVSGFLELRDVSFGYSRQNQPLIDGLNLSVAPGRCIALVGPSGSGKSTVGRLASGMITPWGGEVLLDGKPLQAWHRSTLAKALAVVEQDVALFDGTVRDNVTLWDRSIPQGDIFDVLDDVGMFEKIMSMPGTLEAALGEGGRNLSGGQRQRIEIASALIRQPKILILDEATSALDTLTEHNVLQAIRRLGCTLVLVAHRLSTIRDCDEIIVLDQGKVAERGSHDELLRLGGIYSRLIEDDS